MSSNCSKQDATDVTGVTVDLQSLSIILEDTQQLTADVQPPTATDKTITWTTGDPTIATVDDNGLVTAVGNGLTSITVTTNDGGYSFTCDVTVIGIKINGIIWAPSNVNAFGTFAIFPEDSGMYYQWNSGIAWSATIPDEIEWAAVSPSAPWLVVNDPCPNGWRVPTKEDFEKLLDVSVDFAWTGNGGRFTHVGESVFFPASGGLYKNQVPEIGTASYWNSTLYNASDASKLYFSQTFTPFMGQDRFDVGYPIRCVKGDK
jgi:uncharacterized protein (TIGR02145 family)